MILPSAAPAAIDDSLGQTHSHFQIYCDAATQPSDQRGVLSCPAVVWGVAQCLLLRLVAARKLHPLWHLLELASRANTRTVRPGAVRAPMIRRAQGTGDTRAGNYCERRPRAAQTATRNGPTASLAVSDHHLMRVARQQQREE